MSDEQERQHEQVQVAQSEQPKQPKDAWGFLSSFADVALVLGITEE